MRQSNTSFTFGMDAIPKMAAKFNKRFVQYDKLMEKRMTLATNMVWRIAHQKRPMISKAQMKAEGRSKRVSDPNALLGVPVQTGTLQESVKQKVTRTRLMGFQGEVASRGVKYAGYVEYGTSKMAARPFMRPAIATTREAIRRMFKLKVDSNL